MTWPEAYTMPDSIENRLSRLEQQIANHLGQQQSIGTSTLPHGNMHAAVTYLVTNGVINRTYDADTIVIADLADIVYSIITDLQLLGLVG